VDRLLHPATDIQTRITANGAQARIFTTQVSVIQYSINMEIALRVYQLFRRDVDGILILSTDW
jgi:hypothetical protein